MMATRQENIDANFIIITAADYADPAALAEKRRLAAETGKLLVEQAQETPSRRAVREHFGADDMPTVARGDTKAFLANLGKIAAGKTRVADEGAG